MAKDVVNQSFVDAAGAGNLPGIRQYLAGGAEINCLHCSDGCRLTPLINAAANGRIEAVEILLEAGADKTMTSGGKTAEEAARANGHKALAELIRDFDYHKRFPDKVIFRDRLEPGDGRVLEEIFNFATLERLTLVRESEHGRVEAMALTAFSSIEDQSEGSRLRQAFNEHLRRGGKADEAAVFRSRLPKARLM